MAGDTADSILKSSPMKKEGCLHTARTEGRQLEPSQTQFSLKKSTVIRKTAPFCSQELKIRKVTSLKKRNNLLSL